MARLLRGGRSSASDRSSLDARPDNYNGGVHNGDGMNVDATINGGSGTDTHSPAGGRVSSGAAGGVHAAAAPAAEPMAAAAAPELDDQDAAAEPHDVSCTLPKMRHPVEEGPVAAPSAPPPGAGEAPVTAIARQELAAAAAATAEQEAGSASGRRPSSPEKQQPGHSGSVIAGADGSAVEQMVEASRHAPLSNEVTDMSAAGTAGDTAAEAAAIVRSSSGADDPFSATATAPGGAAAVAAAETPAVTIDMAQPAGNVAETATVDAAGSTTNADTAAAAEEAQAPAIALPPALPFYRDQLEAPVLAGATARVSTRAHPQEKGPKHAYHIQAGISLSRIGLCISRRLACLLPHASNSRCASRYGCTSRRNTNHMLIVHDDCPALVECIIAARLLVWRVISSVLVWALPGLHLRCNRRSPLAKAITGKLR